VNPILFSVDVTLIDDFPPLLSGNPAEALKVVGEFPAAHQGSGGK